MSPKDKPELVKKKMVKKKIVKKKYVTKKKTLAGKTKKNYLTNNFAHDPERASKAGSKSKKSGLNLKTRIQRILETEAPQKLLKEYEASGLKADDKDILEMLVGKLITEGLKGDIKAIEKILDRVDGKSINRTEISAPGGENLFPHIADKIQNASKSKTKI